MRSPKKKSNNMNLISARKSIPITVGEVLYIKFKGTNVCTDGSNDSQRRWKEKLKNSLCRIVTQKASWNVERDSDASNQRFFSPPFLSLFSSVKWWTKCACKKKSVKSFLIESLAKEMKREIPLFFPINQLFFFFLREKITPNWICDSAHSSLSPPLSLCSRVVTSCCCVQE
jgi:hypothetical protein